MGKINCECNRIKGTAGNWTIDNLIGATVNITSVPVSCDFGIDTGKSYTIKEIGFRVSTDGKTITIIKLKDLDDYFFTWKDLEVVKIIES